jgi:membrane associated rhomboid family serine protease
MKTTFILICTVLYIISIFTDLRPLGFTEGSALYTRLTYIFVHGGFLHYFMNMLSFHFLFTLVKLRIPAKIVFPAMLVGAFLATFGAEMALPTIGASGAVMFLFGAYLVLYPSMNAVLYLLVFIAANALSYIYAHTNPFIHMNGALFGAMFAAGFLIIKKSIIKIQQAA